MNGMDLGDVSVLDVGHGNCVLVTKGDRCCVIDTPTGATLIDTLSDRGVTEIGAIFVSHADADHIGGVTGLLMSRRFRVGSVFVNADAARKSTVWQAFRVAVRDARRVDKVSVAGFTTETKFVEFEPELRITALAPEPELALGSSGISGERMTANSLSGVLLVEQAGVRLVLVPGDLDAAGLRYVLDEKRDITAKVLLFPHHGGLPGGGDADAFCRTLCQAVQPSVVVFSLGRGRFKVTTRRTPAGRRS